MSDRNRTPSRLTTSAAAASGLPTSSSSSASGDRPIRNAIDLLVADHAFVATLFDAYEQADETTEKQSLVKRICMELLTHMTLEEEILYPACREQGVALEALDEAQVEHDTAKILINELLFSPPGVEFYDAKVKVLGEYIEHHIDEEEQPRNGLFAQAKNSRLDLGSMGEQLYSRKHEITQESSASDLDHPHLISIGVKFQPTPHANRR